MKKGSAVGTLPFLFPFSLKPEPQPRDPDSRPRAMTWA